MDYVRSAYSTTMRFGDTPESERTVRWQFVPPDAPLLDRWTVFNSLQWGRRVATTGPGEVVGAARRWNNGIPLPWPYGAVPCGTESDWLSGFGSGSLPELPLGPDGVPTCCGVMPPVPIPPCPLGLPAVMYGQWTNHNDPAMGTLTLDFMLNHVPMSSPPRWETMIDWSPLGGATSSSLQWFPNGGSSLNAMRLISTGCDAFDRMTAANLPPLNCEETEWWYAFNGVFFCVPPGFAQWLYRIRVDPF